MTFEEKKEILNSYADLKNKLAEARNVYDVQLQKMCKITKNSDNYNGFLGFTGHSKIEKGTLKLLDCEKACSRLEWDIKKIENELRKLKYRPRQLVILVDLNRWSISKAAKYLNMDYRNAVLMHQRSINKMFEGSNDVG